MDLSFMLIHPDPSVLWRTPQAAQNKHSNVLLEHGSISSLADVRHLGPGCHRITKDETECLVVVDLGSTNGRLKDEEIP